MSVNTICGHQNNTIKFKFRQTLTALGPILITISLGLAEGYSAILLPQLEEDETWNVSLELSSWIASIATLPMSSGCIVGGFLMEMIGRRMLHLLTCIPCLMGWLLIAFSGHSIELLLAGRFLTGMCVGILSPVLLVYVAETSDPSFRGFLLPGVSFALNLGIAIAHIMGTYLKWKLVASLACTYPLLCFTFMLFVPESPTYLIKQGKIELATKGFMWLRSDSEESRSELNILISKQQHEATQPKKTFGKHLQIFKKPEFYKPLIILLVFFSTMQWSGNNPIAFYTINILKEVLGDSLNPYTSMLIMDAVRIVGSIIGCFGQRYMPRRLLMVLSCLGTLVSLLVLSIYSYLNINIAWLAVLCLVSYIFFVNSGLLPLPYSMSGELFAQSSRGLGSGIVTLFNMILMFVLVKITPALFSELHTGGAFLLFGVSCLVGMVALIWLLPETKDKSLHEIEDFFRGTGRGKSQSEPNNLSIQ
ncbi:facilitated trehalose transporter Tret1-2 homolog [Euwallacea similis]|uniref:facilitated trehalose transporter Tret1-2 homolog n=1 Tax=Euwallacea similis TaxID=1736056 RepID=UPI00344E33BF